MSMYRRRPRRARHDERVAAVVLAAVMTTAARLLFRYRYQLAPVWAALAILAAGAGAHIYLGVWRTALAGLVAAVVVRIVAWRRFDRGPDRRYALDTVVLAGAWITIAAGVGPATRALLIALAVGTAVFGLPWWANHRIRRGVRVQKQIDRWPGVADKVGLAGSRLVGVTVGDYGWTAHLRFSEGKTVAQLTTQLATIESLMSLRPGALQAEPVPTRRDYAYVQVIDTDPHADPIPWPGPCITTATEAIPIGLYDDGGPHLERLFTGRGTRHQLVAGQTDSGKSGLVNRQLVEYVPLPDVVQMLIDLKGGQELGPYRPIAHTVATTTSRATRLLAAIAAVVDARAAAATSKHWPISPEWPAIQVVVDEAAELDDRARDLLDGIARRGRSVGVSLTLATQYPTTDAVPSQAKAQCAIRACFRVTENRHQNSALSTLRASSGADATAIAHDRPGTCFIESPDGTRPSPLRVHWVDEDTIERVVADNVPTPLDDISEAAFRDVFGHPDDENMGDGTDSGHGQRGQVPDSPGGRADTDADNRPDSGDSDDLAPIPAGIPLAALSVDTPDRPVRTKLTTAQAGRVLDETLAAAGMDGTSPRALVEATGMSRRWVNKALETRIDTGTVEWLTHGTYRHVEQEHTPA